MLARDPIEAIEQAESFLATHSLSEYCDEIARPAISLAQKDSERGVLEPSKVSILRETIESLFADLVRENWTSEREAYAMPSAGDGKLPFLGKDQMVSTWRSEEPALLVGVYSELDEAAAVILATLAEIHGAKPKIERLETLRGGNAPSLDLSSTTLVCLSTVDIKAPAHIHYAARV